MRWIPLLFIATSLMAQDAEMWMEQGIELFRSAKYSEAATAFERAVAADPNSVRAHQYLGASYMQAFIPGMQSTENPIYADSARREFLRVLELDSGNTLAMTSLGSLFLNQKNWDEAQRWFEKLVAIDPRNADAYYSMGFIAWSKWYPAWSEARKKLGMRQEDSGPMADGEVKQQLKVDLSRMIEDGLRAFEKALAINPRYADAMAYVNLLIRERADLRDTKAEYQRDIAEADVWVDKALATKKQLAEAHANPATAVRRIRVGPGVAEERKIHDVGPEYPPDAREARIRGTVRVAIVVGYDGNVVDAKPISGHPLLIPVALEAVKQWEYRPMQVNGQPVQIETEVSVNFKPR
jgi:TonB family protein